MTNVPCRMVRSVGNLQYSCSFQYKSIVSHMPALKLQTIIPNSSNIFLKSQQRKCLHQNLPRSNSTPQNQFYRRKLPDTCISFCSEMGKTIFQEALLSGHMDGYFRLAAQFRTQDEPAFCGLSTLVMVLNTLEVDPKRVWKGPWRWYHENMLDCCIPLDIVIKYGITMDQFACLATCNMLNVRMVRVNKNMRLQLFRDTVKLVTQRTDQVLVVSYSRRILNQTGEGHFSPIGGYNVERDMVLIMDTARFKYPPHWVPLILLFEAMHEIDITSGLPRGYFILSKNRLIPGLLFRLAPNLSPIGLESNLSCFLCRWEALIATDLTKSDFIGEEVVEMVALELLNIMVGIDDNSFLMSLHLDQAFVDQMSLEGHLSNIENLIESLERLPLFRTLSKRIPALIKGVDGVNSNINNTMEQPFVLSRVHYMVMFFLSWPYHNCKEGCVGDALRRYSTIQLNRPDCELLQNECARLRQQIISILSYAKACCKSTSS